jgi:hypothetical protein
MGLKCSNEKCEEYHSAHLNFPGDECVCGEFLEATHEPEKVT